jgi:hypothetical protein
MITTAEEIINKFGQLPTLEKKQVISIILRDSLEVETPILSDEELVFNAEDIFLELDRREEEDAKS